MADHMTAEQLITQIRNVELYARAKLDQVEELWSACFALTAVANSLASITTSLSALPAQGDGWLPIESAPRDKRVGLWLPHGGDGNRGYPTHGSWNDDRFNRRSRPFWDFDSAVNASHARANQPTHWREEAPAPKANDHG